MYRKFIWDWKGLAMNVTTFGKLSNNLVVVVVIIVLCLKYEALLRVLSLLSLYLFIL